MKSNILAGFGILVAVFAVVVCVYGLLNQVEYTPAFTPVADPEPVWEFTVIDEGRVNHEFGWIVKDLEGNYHIFYDQLEYLKFIGAVTEW